MAGSFKDFFVSTQQALRDSPARGQVTLAAETRQVAGLVSEAAVRDFRFKVDELPALGGSNSGPNPVELLLAALGACQEITYRLYADTLGIPLNDVSVKVTGRLDLRGFFAVEESVRPGFRDIHATVTIDSPASADDIERLKATVDRHCPLLDILRTVTPVKVQCARRQHRRQSAA